MKKNNIVPETNTLLVVDDNMNNIQVLASMLTNNGFNVEFATNGKSALQWIEEESFDLVLLDIMMPEMDGFEVCEKIRNNKRYKELPIIFLTAKTDKESIVKGFTKGGSDYLTKPFDQRELIARVNTHLELKKSRDKLNEVNIWLERKVAERTEELNLALAELTSINKKLLQLDEVKSEFLKMISHEIRTPLNGIIGFTDIIKNSNEAEPLMDYIDLLEQSAMRLEKFALNALLWTSLKVGNYFIQYKDLNLNSILHKCVTNKKDAIAEKNISVRIACDPGLVLRSDEELIENAINLIIDNAYRFTPENGKIQITAKVNKKVISINIVDSGPGFNETAMENLFEFFGSGEHHFDQHVGMGLSLANQIMKALVGEVKVKNMEEGGASVTLKHPAKS